MTKNWWDDVNSPAFWDYLNGLADEVPPEQRESLRARAVRAVNKGWKHVGLWPGYDTDFNALPVEEDDLVGSRPGRGFGFIPLELEAIE